MEKPTRTPSVCEIHFNPFAKIDDLKAQRREINEALEMHWNKDLKLTHAQGEMLVRMLAKVESAIVVAEAVDCTQEELKLIIT